MPDQQDPEDPEDPQGKQHLLPERFLDHAKTMLLPEEGAPMKF